MWISLSSLVFFNLTFFLWFHRVIVSVSTVWLILENIGKLDIFLLMCAADKVWFTELALICNNIRSGCNSHAQDLTLILKIIGQCDVKHILMSQINTITPVLKISTYIITSIIAHPVGLAVILVIMSVLTFKAAVILY